MTETKMHSLFWDMVYNYAPPNCTNTVTTKSKQVLHWTSITYIAVEAIFSRRLVGRWVRIIVPYAYRIVTATSDEWTTRQQLAMMICIIGVCLQQKSKCLCKYNPPFCLYSPLAVLTTGEAKTSLGKPLGIGAIFTCRTMVGG